MAKVADIKLTWKKSPSADVAKQKVVLFVDGQESSAEFGPEVEEFMITVKALQTVTFTVITTDTEGIEVPSVSYTFTLGDLEAPFPAVDLGHIVVAIRDEPDPEPEPVL